MTYNEPKRSSDAYRRDGSVKRLNWERAPNLNPSIGKSVDAPRVGKLGDVTNTDMTCKSCC